LAAFQQDLVITVTVEELWDYANRVQGRERPETERAQALGGRNQSRVVEAYSGVEVESFEFARNGHVSLVVMVPYHLLPDTAYRLGQYLDWLATQEAQRPSEGADGTGQGVEAGTGAGTGSAP
jgi:hypothetical protein